MTFRNKAAVAAAAIAAFSLSAPTIAWADKPELKVSGHDAVQGATQVAIGAFNVGFIFESTDQTAKTGGMIGAFGGTTKAKSTLVGVTPEMMQQVTDAAYQDMVGQLTAAGFTVVDPASVFAAPELSNPHGHDAPLEVNIALEKGSKGKATYYKPSVLPSVIMIAGDFQGSGMSSMGLQMSAGQAGMALSNYAKANGVPVVDVTYLIDFSQQKRPGAFSFGGLKVNASLSVSPAYSRMSVLGANGKTITLTLNQPVAVEGEFIEERDATSKTDKTMQSAANVAGGVAAVFGMGGMKFGKTRKFEFTAKPGNYEEGATKAASLTNQMMVNQIATMR